MKPIVVKSTPEARADWEQAQYTQTCERTFSARRREAFKRLVNEAKSSRDPAIRGAVTEYLASVEMHNFFSERGRSKESEE